MGIKNGQSGTGDVQVSSKRQNVQMFRQGLPRRAARNETAKRLPFSNWQRQTAGITELPILGE